MKTRHILLLLCLYGASSLYAIDVTVTVEPPQIMPGDLAVISARLESPDYASFKLDLPPHDLLHLVASEPGTVELYQGLYQQEHRWIVQAKSSGMVQWKGLEATLLRSGEEQTIQLAPLQLEIRSYTDLDDSNEPERLREEVKPQERRPPRSFLLLLLPLVIVLVAVFYRVKGGRREL